MSRRVVVLGATSAIGRAIAEELARSGDTLHLGGRDEEELQSITADLHIRFEVQVTCSAFEATDFAAHDSYLDDATIALGGLEGVVVVFGDIGDAARSAREPDYARTIHDGNYTGAASILTFAANRLEEKGAGFIVCVGSVAGDRGRQSNYIYGAAKGALELFLQGLRNRLTPAGVQVLTVKPGFVDSPMTYGKDGLFLVASPEKVARSIVRAQRRGRNVIYVPWFWRWIMLIIKLIPEPIFRRMKM